MNDIVARLTLKRVRRERCRAGGPVRGELRADSPILLEKSRRQHQFDTTAQSRLDEVPGDASKADARDPDVRIDNDLHRALCTFFTAAATSVRVSPVSLAARRARSS